MKHQLRCLKVRVCICVRDLNCGVNKDLVITVSGACGMRWLIQGSSESYIPQLCQTVQSQFIGSQPLQHSILILWCFLINLGQMEEDYYTPSNVYREQWKGSQFSAVAAHLDLLFRVVHIYLSK